MKSHEKSSKFTIISEAQHGPWSPVLSQAWSPPQICGPWWKWSAPKCRRSWPRRAQTPSASWRKPNWSIPLTYIYIYSHPEVDRISEIFKKDFKKKVGIFSKPSVFTRFSSLLSHFLASFGHGSGEILKNTKIKQHQKIFQLPVFDLPEKGRNIPTTCFFFSGRHPT